MMTAILKKSEIIRFVSAFENVMAFDADHNQYYISYDDLLKALHTNSDFEIVKKRVRTWIVPLE